MEHIVAFCGLICTDCEAYRVTQTNDQAGAEALVAKWRVEYNSPNMPLAAVICDGCLASDGRLGGYCSQCPIRACGIEHGVANCAYCTDFTTCEKITDFLAKVPQARVTLDGIRATL
jgi:hypothetical protein